MKIKTSQLTGIALDWAVATCEGFTPFADGISWIIDKAGTYLQLPKYSADWAHGGPIIERELLAPDPELDHNCKCFRWCCRNWNGDGGYLYGPTPLVAAMRCYVASKLGDEVDIPDELH